MTFRSFDPAVLRHVPYERRVGGAAERILTRDDFARAVDEITAWPGYEATPLHRLGGLAEELGVAGLFYKDEGARFGLGSFKALGGSYAALRVLGRELTRRLGTEISLSDIRKGKYAAEVAEITLVSATDGNHGRSLAWGCQWFGAPCRIYVHAEVSDRRVESMRELGATVIRIAGDYDESVLLSRRDAEENGWFVVSDTSWEGYTDPPKDVMAGYGVMTREICAAMAEPPTHVFLQCGVGGLAASVAAYLRQTWRDRSPRLVIVEPDLAPCLFESARAGEATSVRVDRETVMAGLSCGAPSAIAWAILDEEASDFLTIPDAVIGPTMRRLERPIGHDPVIRAGESGVAGLAAAILACRSERMRHALDLDERSSILTIGSEGITDPVIHRQMMLEAANA